VRWRQLRHRPYWSQHHSVEVTEKKPDGLTIVPWVRGRSLVWNFTCPDTLASSHLNRAVLGPGAVANEAEEKKKSKYSSLPSLYDFTPIAVGTFGAVRESAMDFLQELSRRITNTAAEPRSFMFLIQHLSVVVQRGNAVCVTCTAPSSPSRHSMTVLSALYWIYKAICYFCEMS